MTITVLPTPPLPTDTPADFNTKAFNLLGALPAFVTETNALGVDVTAKQGTASAAATAAVASALAADASAVAAAASAVSAGTQAGNAATSAGNANGSAVAAAASAASIVAQVATATHGAAAKATPVDADELPLADSAAAFGLKKVTWLAIKTVLSGLFALKSEILGVLGSAGTAAPANVASVSAVDLGAVTSRQIVLTGTTQVDTVVCPVGWVFFVKAAGAIKLKAAVTGTGADIRLTAGDSFTWRATAANTVELINLVRGSGVSTVPLRGWIAGLRVSNNAANAGTDIDVSVGAAADSTNVVLLSLVAALTKQLHVAWAAGNAAGGRLDAAISDGTWHVHLISNGVLVDVGLSKSATAPMAEPNWPAGYTNFRRILSVVREGGAIAPFSQRGDKVLWKSISTLDMNSAAGTVASLLTVRTFEGVPTDAILSLLYLNTAAINQCLYVSSLDQNDETADLGGSARADVVSQNTGCYAAGSKTVRTNTSRQVRVRTDNGSNFTRISTVGLIDRRGQDD